MRASEAEFCSEFSSRYLHGYLKGGYLSFDLLGVATVDQFGRAKRREARAWIMKLFFLYIVLLYSNRMKHEESSNGGCSMKCRLRKLSPGSTEVART
jgi:hypothetical protein